MNIGVIGCGSIGKRHISNLLKIDGLSLFIYDSMKETMESVSKEYNVKSFGDAESLFREGNLDAVFICTPNNLHTKFVKMGLENNCHVFVEKPISHNLEGLDELERMAKEKNKMVFVACNMRFHNSIKKVKSLLDSVGKVYSVRAEFGHYLPNWRPSADYSKIYSASKEQGGGILLDAIHEFDYVSWMLGEPSEIFCLVGKLSDLKIDVEDTAEVLLKTKEGIIAEIHLDYLQKVKRRSCQVIGSKGTIVWVSTGKSPEESEVRFYDAEKNKWEVHKEVINPNDAYLEEVTHFVNCVAGKESPISDIGSGIMALKMVLGAKESSTSSQSMKF